MKTFGALWFMVVYSVVYMSHAQDEDAIVLPQHMTAMINILKADLQSAVQDIKAELKAHTEDKINEATGELKMSTMKEVATLKHLLDTDECTELSHNCSADAKCTDTMVSFRCKCNDGFTGDGYSCEVIRRVKEGPSEITDENLLEFATLFETSNPGNVSVHIQGQPKTMPKLKEVLLAIAEGAISVDTLRLNHLFKYPEDNPENNELLPIIGNILNKFEVKEYSGPVIQGDQPIKESMNWLSVSLSDYNSLHRLQTQLKDRMRQFYKLRIRVDLSIEEPRIEDILPLRGDIAEFLYLQFPDVTSLADAAKAARLARQLLPITGTKWFDAIQFPRMQMKDDIETAALLQSLKGIRVEWSITLPPPSYPLSDERKANLSTLAKDATGCVEGIHWKDHSDFY